MIIDKRVHHLLGSRGVWADVFQVNTRAFKLFHSGPEVPPYQLREGRERRFSCQIEAYQRITDQDSWLAAHTATFYGSCLIDDVIAENGSSIKANYLLHCCYSMEVSDLGCID